MGPAAIVIALSATAAFALEPGTYVANLDGSNMRKIAGPTTPLWFPAADRLLLETTNAFYQIAPDGSGKSLVYRDASVAHLWEAKLSASGRCIAVVAEMPQALDTTLRLISVGEGRMLRTMALQNVDLAGESMSADALFDWCRQDDVIAFTALESTAKQPGLWICDTGACRLSHLATDLSADAVAWRADEPAVVASCHGQLIAVTPENGEETKRVRLGRLAGLHEAFHLNQFTWLPRIDAVFCCPWDQTQRPGLFSAQGQPREPAIGRNGPTYLLWSSPDGRRLILLNYDTGEAGTGPYVRVMAGSAGEPWASLKAVYSLGDGQVSISPDGTKMAIGVGASG